MAPKLLWPQNLFNPNYMCNIKNQFVRLLVYGFGGALAGLLGGFVLGLGIWGLQELVCAINLKNHCEDFLNVSTFLGSGAGAFLGALLGGLSALRKK